mgnify:CR=1 FL=1
MTRHVAPCPQEDIDRNALAILKAPGLLRKYLT